MADGAQIIILIYTALISQTAHRPAPKVYQSLDPRLNLNILLIPTLIFTGDEKVRNLESLFDRISLSVARV